MGFFDFLSAPEQDPTKKKKVGAMPGGTVDEFDTSQYPLNTEELFAGYGPKTPQEDPKKVADVASRERYRSVEKDVLKGESAFLQQAKNLFLNATRDTTGPTSTNKDFIAVANALERGELTLPQVGADIEQILKTNKDLSPEMSKRMATLSSNIRYVMDKRRNLDEAPVPDLGPGADPEAMRKDFEDLSQKATRARMEADTLGVLTKGPKQKEADLYSGQALALKGHLDEAGKPQEKPLTFAEKNSDPTPPPTNPQPVESQFKTLGIKRQQMIQSLTDIVKGVGINGDEWDDDVPTQSGIKRILSVIDPEGSFAQKLAADLVAEKASQTQAEDAKRLDERRRSIGKEVDLKIEAQAQKSELRQLYQSLNDQPFMRSWIGIALYLVIGTLTGPTNAARLLGIGRNRNAILGEIEAIKEEMRMTSRSQERQEKMSYAYRKEAIRQLKEDREYRRRKDDSIQEIYLRHKLILERAKRSPVEGFKPHISKMEQDYARTLKSMSEAEKIIGNNLLSDRDPKKIAASREYDVLKKRAAEIDKELLGLTNKVAPGTYEMEE